MLQNSSICLLFLDAFLVFGAALCVAATRAMVHVNMCLYQHRVNADLASVKFPPLPRPIVIRVFAVLSAILFHISEFFIVIISVGFVRARVNSVLVK
jgi:hypothetical protein